MQFSDKKPRDTEASTIALQPDSSEWKRFNIDIKQSGIQLSAQEHQRISDDINAVYYFFNKKLFLDIYKTVPVAVKLFGEKSDYEVYISRNKGAHKNTRGTYFRSRNEIAVYMREDREGTFRTIKHEASHAIIHTLLPYTPGWLNEGIAENMEVMMVDESAAYLEPHQENYTNLTKYNNRDMMPSVEEMIAYKSSVWINKNRASNYVLQTQAGELVRMLLSEPIGKSFLTKIIHLFKAGDKTLVSRLAEQHYIGGTFTLREKWERWIRRGNSQRIDL